MDQISVALADLQAAEAEHRAAAERLRAAADRVRLAVEAGRVAPPPAQPQQTGLIRLTDFARGRSWPSLRTLRRWTSEGEPPAGFAGAGIIHTIGRSVLIDPVAFDRWATGQIPQVEPPRKGRPRRKI